MAGPPYAELVRVSSQGQADRDSPQTQRNELARLRERMPGVLIERIDSVVSGASNERADLERLFALLAGKKIKQVRVRHVDRLTRHPDPRHRAAILGALMDAGAVIVEASGRVIDPSDEMGELDATLQGWFAAKERKRIRERTLARRKELAAEGKLQGLPPYARSWDKRTCTWGVIEKDAETYRRIFAELLGGAPLDQIAAGLNRDGIATPRGRLWTGAHVSRLVRHRGAIGILKGWGHTFKCPPIVDEVTFQKAQAVLKRNRTKGPHGKHPALCRGILVCECGAKMYVQRGGKVGDERSYYVCQTTRVSGCRRWHSVAKVDAAVKAALLADARGDKTAHGKAATTPGAPVDLTSIRKAQQAMKRIDAEEERLARGLLAGTIREATHAKLADELATRRRVAELDLSALLARRSAEERAARATKDEREALRRIAAGLERASFPAWRRYVEGMFPPGCWIRLDASGRLTLRGMRSFRFDRMDRGDSIPAPALHGAAVVLTAVATRG